MQEKLKNDLCKFALLPDFSPAITFFGSARINQNHAYCKAAMSLAKLCVEASFCVITGGGGGIMSAANKGAISAKNKNVKRVVSAGFNVFLPFEQKSNDFFRT